MLECVVNISEGRDPGVVDAIAGSAGADLLDIHRDGDHHRSVLTLAGEAAPRAVAAETVARLDIGAHTGVHPRTGTLDVVPFIALDGSTEADAVTARDAFARWLTGSLGVPAACYGPSSLLAPHRSLPELRRHLRDGGRPDLGGPEPHPRAGVTAVGARPPLVAYNVWLDPAGAAPAVVLATARRLATAVRGGAVRALGMAVTDPSIGQTAMVSTNLIDPARWGPATLVDAVASRAPIARCELVGLVPAAVLEATPTQRWAELDLDPARTIEARLERRATGDAGS